MLTTPKGLTPWTEGIAPRHLKNALLPGQGWGAVPEITHRKGQKSTFIYGNDAKVKTVPNVPLGFSGYGMTNAKHFW